MKPWRDVYSTVFWDRVVQRYRSGDLSSKSATVGRWFRSIGKDGRVLPKQVEAISRTLQTYHAARKDDLGNFARRSMLLRTIQDHCDDYVRKYGIDVSCKQGGHDDSLTSLDAFVWSLGRRAGRKAKYIQDLREFYWAEDARPGGSRGNAATLIAYLRAPIHGHDGLCHLQAGVKLEKHDPYHRAFEMHIRDDGSITGEDIMGAPMVYAFAQWAGLISAETGWLNGQTFANCNPNPTPFFVWLENHPICTAARGDSFGGEVLLAPWDLAKAVTGVAYSRADLFQGDKIIWAFPKDGLLMKVPIGQLADPRSAVLPFHTCTPEYPGKGHETQSAAYVWSVGGDIFTGVHKPGALHHTTFVSGKKVRCAGMIRVRGGKVEQVSNDSGHYRPDSREHLRPFVQFLIASGVLAPGAMVRGHGFQPMAPNEFLRAARPLPPATPRR
jgi:hypothetical protein